MKALAVCVASIPWLLLGVGVVLILAMPWWLLMTEGSWILVLSVYGGVAVALAYWWAVKYLESVR